VRPPELSSGLDAVDANHQSGRLIRRRK
jgi:hypothetical protein